MCSIMAGPTPMSAPAAAIIRSFRPPSPSRRSRASACWSGPAWSKREREALLLQAAVQVADRLGVSSLHVTFLTREEWQLAGELGFLQRTDQQFHWRNEGYGSFDDFLAALTSRKRKAIRKERREALEGGVEIEWVTGRDLTEAHWDAFFAFYMDTGSRKWGTPYLTRACFSLLGETMADRILLVFAKRSGRYVAGALNCDRPGRAIRPLLGRARGSPLPPFRGLLLPGHRVRHRPQARAGSRPARKARTSSPAAICRARPIAPITSPIPACAAPSPIISSASGARSPGRSRCSPRNRPTAVKSDGVIPAQRVSSSPGGWL